MNQKNKNETSGRGKGQAGRGTGRAAGRGRGKKQDIVFKAPTGDAGKNFFQGHLVDTKAPSKRNSDQRSPSESENQRKRPAKVTAINTESNDKPPHAPLTPEATRAMLARSNKSTNAIDKGVAHKPTLPPKNSTSTPSTSKQSKIKIKIK